MSTSRVHSPPKYDFLFKLLLLGDQHVGKTSFLMRYIQDSDCLTNIATIGIDFRMKTIELEGIRIKLLIWDRSGVERYKTIERTYYREAMGVLLLYDITSYKSFDSIRYWLYRVEELAPPDVPILLVGNKSDMKSHRVIPKERGEQLAKKLNILFLEVSAKSNTNVNEAIETLVRLILLKRSKSNTHIKLRFLVIGDNCTGKSSILLRYRHEKGPLNDRDKKTEFICKSLCINNKEILIRAYEHEQITYKNVEGIILVYDITRKESFDNITKWLQDIETQASPDVQCILVGNKLDMESERQLPKEKGEELAQKLKMPFFETSATENVNIAEVFETLTRQILKEQEPSLFQTFAKLFRGKGKKSFAIDLQKPASSALQKPLSLSINKFTEIDQMHLHSALKSGSVFTSIIKVVVQGPARSGKTSVKCLILSQPYESNISTGCVESPQIAIGEFSMSQYGQLNEYHWELVNDKKMIEKFANEIRSLIKEHDFKNSKEDVVYPMVPLKPDTGSVTTKMPAVSANNIASTFPISGKTSIATVGVSCPVSLEPPVHLPKVNDSATHQLSDIVNKASTKGIKLALHKEWLYFIDSGGQIQFQQLLQSFIPCASVLMLVINLAKDLSSQSSTVLQCQDGEYIVSGHSPTVETLLKRLILMVNSSVQQQQLVNDTELSQVIIKPPEKLKIITLATHRDMYDERLKNGDKVESIEEKEEKLSKIFQSIEGNLSYHDVTSGKILSEVDGCKASQGMFGDPVIKEIRAELKDQAFKVNIPLMWYAFEILLRQEAIKGCGVLSLEECQATGLGLGLHIEEIQSALKFFYLLNTILYYPGVSDLVFVLPHSLIEVVSDLMILVCKIRNGVKVGRGAVDTKKMADHGIISKDVFAKSQKSVKISSYFHSFSSEVLKIFQHLLIATELPDNKFFMPALLPLINPSEVNPVHNSTSCPLLFYFKKGAPIGLFCAMIVHLLSLTYHGRSLWVIDESDSKIYSNYITLRKIGGGKVSFIEEHDLFEVRCELTEDQVEVKKELITAIDETITTRRIIKEMQPEVGFYCPCTVDPEATHVATIWEEDKWTLYCTSKENVIQLIPENSFCWSWFESINHEIINDSEEKHVLSTIIANKPEKHMLLRLLSSITAKWQQMGDLLGVDPNTIEGLCYSNFSDNVKMSKMLQSWLDNEPTPATWNNIISIIEGPLQKKSLADDIRQQLLLAPTTDSTTQ